MIIKIYLLSIIIFALVILGYLLLNAKPLPYEAIISFGDSISDTGNSAKDHSIYPMHPAYGSTYFKHASGRSSDGRLVIDFIAEAYGLPFLPAYLNLTKDQDVKKGVNFAYAGATALDPEYGGAMRSVIATSKNHCFLWERLVGMIYILSLIQPNNNNITQIREIIPPIVESITNTTTELIEGAVELGIPGNFPIGCNAFLLTLVNSTKKEDYDQFGCLIAYNTLIEYFNEQVKHAIETLRKKYPQANIMYFDYYNDAKRLFQAPEQYGLTSDKNEILKACFGAGGPYNLRYNGVLTVCPDPSKRINWDGPHMTEAAYKIIAKGLVEGPFVDPPLKSSHFKIT